MRQVRVAGDDPRTDQNNDRFLVTQVVAFLLSASLGRRSVCLGPGLVAVCSFPVLGVGCRSRVPWPLPLWLVAALVFVVPGPVLAFVGKGDVPRTDPFVPLPVRASFRCSLICWQYWSVDFEGVFLRWYISWFTPLPHSFVDFWQSVSTCFQPTGGGRWKNLHVQSGLSVEVYVSFNFSLVSAFGFHCGDPCPTLQV